MSTRLLMFTILCTFQNFVLFESSSQCAILDTSATSSPDGDWQTTLTPASNELYAFTVSYQHITLNIHSKLPTYNNFKQSIQ